MRRAKIVCTLGPATSSAERLSELVAAGMDVARLNLAHGAYEDHEKVYLEVRRASDESGRAVGVLVDLQGPKIRTGRFADGPVQLENGARFTITTTTSWATRTASRRPTRASRGTSAPVTGCSSTTAR